MGRRKKALDIIPGTDVDSTSPNQTQDTELAIEQHVTQYGSSERTKKSYSIYESGARAYLVELMAERTRKKIKDHRSDKDLARALDSTPNQYSAYVLSLYIGEKCCKGPKQCGKSTAETIYSTWVKIWTKSGYGGDYHLDQTTGKVTGCPAKAYDVKQLIKSVKAREARKGTAAMRHHAEAMSRESMHALISVYSEGQCPNARLENPPLNNAEALKTLDWHGFFRAFATTAFTLFARNNETMKIQFGDLDLDAVGPAPKCRPHIVVTLWERKGWEKSAGNDRATSQAFEVYQQQYPEIDMYSHLRRWLKYLSLRLGRPLEADNYVFPHIAQNGAIHIKEPVSYDTIAKVLEEFRCAAGLKKPFTTHCFRRGGAQYRFQYAPPKERWTLNCIQWWGGWASGDSVDVLTSYLVDSLHTLENTYQHALDPDRGPAIDRQLFEGSNRLYEPASLEDILDLRASLTSEVQGYLSDMFTRLEVRAQSAGQCLSTSSARTSSPLSPHITTSPTQGNVHIASFEPTPFAFQAPPQVLQAAAPPTAHTEPLYLGRALGTTSAQQAPVAQPPIPRSQNKATQRRAVAIPGVYIPTLPSGAQAWRKAVEQWEVGGKGLIPLRDWQSEWYTGDMRTTFGSKRSQRKLVALEFNRLGRDENLFLSTYPEANRGIRALLKAIRKRAPPETVAARRRSKNGAPSERDSNESNQRTSSDGSDSE